MRAETMRTFAWVVLAAATATTDVPVLRRCVGPDGAVSWQSARCDANAREDTVRAFDRVSATPTPKTPAAAPARAPSPRTLPHRRPPSRRDDDARRRCDAARRAADTARERDWNRLGFVERSRLDADVAAACAR
jgi:hypothetical protein